MSYHTEVEGRVRLAVIIKAAPNLGRKHGETVCVAGIDYDGNWHRLYPVPFKDLKSDQKFSRWDVIEVDWKRPHDDERSESKRIFSQTLTVVGQVPERERHGFARRALVADLDEQLRLKRSFALIRPMKPKFSWKRWEEGELAVERKQRKEMRAQLDMFGESVLEREPPPYKFYFNFDFGGKNHTHQCIDWETETTFFKWRNLYGEQSALERMAHKFGEEWPERGVAFAMGTHRVPIYKSWLLSAILRVDEERQGTLF